MSPHVLTPLMRPRSIAVLGASPRPNTLGNNAVANLQRFGYGGGIYPVHPSATEVAGLPAFSSLSELPGTPDCVVVALSADRVVAALEEAASLGVRAAVVFASGFAETDSEGRLRQSELQTLCERAKLSICGPNCLGLVNVAERISLYSSSVPEGLKSGGLAVVSHSGSGCIALSTLGRFGLSYMVSAGNAAVVDMAGYLEFLAGDASTSVVALFMEQLREPERFAQAMSAMHRAGKPVIALKVGRSAKGAAASAAHTGSLAGSAEAYAAFFRANGVIAVDDLDEMAESIALMLAVRTLPEGDGLGIISVSGGETAMLCDVAERVGIRLPDPGADSRARLRSALPGFGTASNPLDATGNAVYDVSVYEACMQALASDPDIAMLAVAQDCSPGLSRLGCGNYRRIAETVASVASQLGKPVAFFNPTAGGLHPHVIEPFEKTGVAVMQGTRASLLAIRRLFEYARRLRAPVLSAPGMTKPEPDWVARLETGTPFTEREAKRFLSACGIPVTRESLARSEDDAVAAAAGLGYPVVLKIESPDIAHKTEVGGVRVGLQDPLAVSAAYRQILASVKDKAPQAQITGVVVQEMISGGVEMIAGLSHYEPFGMGIVAGSGGVMVELVKDAALALVPLDRARAIELVGATRSQKLLDGFRGAPRADVHAFAHLLEALSRIASEYGDLIEAIDLNPVAVLPEGQGVCVLDALVIPRKVGAGEPYPRDAGAAAPAPPEPRTPSPTVNPTCRNLKRTSMATYTTITLERDGAVAVLTLNRPDKMNSLSDQLLADIRGAMAELEPDEAIRALIVTGAGRAFSAGFDITPREKPRTTVQDWRDHAKDGNDTWLKIWRSRLPVVAAVNGFCLGGGCDLSMTCDYTLAADTAQFGEPEIEFCSAPPFLIMPWVAGMKHAKELLLLGERVSADDAWRMGIVNRVVPAANLMQEARKVALRMARLPAIAMKQNKEAINRAYDMRGLMANIDYGQEMFCLTSMAPSPEGAAFRKIAREQGLKAAIRWRDEQFK